MIKLAIPVQNYSHSQKWKKSRGLVKSKSKMSKSKKNRSYHVFNVGKLMQKGPGSNLEWVNCTSIRPLLSMPQESASQLLGVKKSILKRKFRNMNMGRWPSHRRTPTEKFQKRQLAYLVNTKNVKEPKMIDTQTMKFLRQECRFINMYDNYGYKRPNVILLTSSGYCGLE